MTSESNFIKLLGEELKMIRDKKGLTQEKVAEVAGIARERISEIENGKKNTTLATLEKIMDALDIAPQEIFNFGRLNNVPDIADKKILIDIHRSVLMERNLDEVEYVVNTTNEFLKTIDKK